MNKHLRRPGIQKLICVLYILAETLMTLYVFFFEKSAEQFNGVFLSIALIGVILSLTVSMVPNVRDRVHGLVLCITLYTMSVIFAICTNNFRIAHIGIASNMILTCLYEEISIIRPQFIVTLGLYVGMVPYYVITRYPDTDWVAEYVCTVAAITISFLILIYLVDRLTRYKRVIIENSMSSQDMLRVVEMKRKEANEAVRAKSMFLSNMSHEIRTPINAILGMDEIILRDSNEENIIEYAGKIQNAGNTLMSLINDILDFSKIESGRMELAPEAYQSADLFNDVYDMICLRTEDKGLSLVFNVAANLPTTLEGDTLRVKQVLINVLNNAVKYTEKGTITMTVNWEFTPKGEALIHVAVADTGIGIKKEDIDRIFRSFERVDTDKTKSIEGTGLGMSITKDLLAMMQGSIRVESEYGRGSTFYMDFIQGIVNLQEMGTFHPKNSFFNLKEHRRNAFICPLAKALIVDDNEMNLLVVKGLLKQSKMEIDMAQSGMQALSMVTQKQYDLIFMDHMMPEMDGLETFEHMKTLEGNLCSKTPIVALTANAIVGAKEMYLEHGFTDYLSKPLHTDQLEDVLLKYIPEYMIEYVEDAKAEIKAELPQIPGIDYATGLSYAADDNEQYLANMRLFHQKSLEKQLLYEDLLNAENWERFTVEVHSLKSNARYIGADMLGELAYELEQAGKAKQGEYIRSHWPGLKEAWNSLLHSLDEFLGPQANTANDSKNLPIDEEILQRKLEKIIQALRDYEIDDAVERLQNLLDYDLPNEQKNAIKNALQEAENFNYKLAEEILQSNMQ